MYKGGETPSTSGSSNDAELAEAPDPYAGLADSGDSDVHVLGHSKPLLNNGNDGHDYSVYGMGRRRLREDLPSQSSIIPGTLAVALCLLIGVVLFRITRAFWHPSVKESTDDLRPSDVILGHTAP